MSADTCKQCGHRVDGEYWIYPGMRRPVVVFAKTKEEAEKLVSKSPQYDGFNTGVYAVVEFTQMCKDGTA